jgi:hypothetical protein
MKEQMDVRIDEPREEGSITEVDDFGIGRMLDRRSNFCDALALYAHLTGLDNLPGLHIQQAGRTEDDRMSRRCGRLCNQIEEKREWAKSDEEPRALGHMGRDGNTVNSLIPDGLSRIGDLDHVSQCDESRPEVSELCKTENSDE